MTTIENQETFLVYKRMIYPTEGMRLGLGDAMMLVLRDGLGGGRSTTFLLRSLERGGEYGDIYFLTSQ